MFGLLKSVYLLVPIPAGSAMILALASTLSAHALLAPQSGQRPNPNIDYEKQRTEQYDQQQQQQQQNARHSGNGIHQAQGLTRSDALWKDLMRENFRRRYKAIRIGAEELTQLASQLQSYVESAPDPQLPRVMLAKVATMQTLAHEVRVNMGGRSFPKVKPSAHATNALGTSAITGLDRKQLLMERSKGVTDLASKLKKAVEGYLASDNELTVSVDALKRSTDKMRFDPNAVEILKTSLQLEQLACDIRTEKPVIGLSR